MKRRGYESWLQEAKNRGWEVPTSEMPPAELAGINYWSRMDEFERMERAGRPIPPQRRAHG